MMEPTITLYGSPHCGDCIRTRAFLETHNIRYTEININQHPEAAAKVKQINQGYASTPTLVFSDGSTLTEPSNQALKNKLLQLGLL